VDPTKPVARWMRFVFWLGLPRAKGNPFFSASPDLVDVAKVEWLLGCFLALPAY